MAPRRPPPPPTWQVVASEYLHQSRWRRIRLDRLRPDAGPELTYTYLEAPRAAFVVPLTTAERVVLIRQYRYPIRAWVWEIPAGAVEDGESSAETARRELLEEVGGTCEAIELVASFYTSPAHGDMHGDYYLATGVRLGAARREAHEYIELAEFPVDEALAMARRGDVQEGQSALALLAAEPRLRGRASPPWNTGSLVAVNQEAETSAHSP